MKTQTRRINLSLPTVENDQLNELCEYFKEKPTPTLKRCINEMHKKHARQLKKEK